VLGVFTGQLGFEDDGHRGARSWLMWQTRVTQGASGGAIGWAKRLPAHPLVDAALAAGRVSTSWAKQVCDWSDKLPAGRRGAADQILLAAVAGGAALADLSGLAEEMFRRAAPSDRDDGDRDGPDGDSSGDEDGGDEDGAGGLGGGAGDPGAGAGDPGAGASGGPGGGDDGGFGDRSLQLDLHFRGAGHLLGDLTPECAAALAAVRESLGKKAGPEDDRTRPQRDHDALEEAPRSADPADLPPRVLARLQDLLLAAAAGVLSGPAGLASFLRTGLLAAEFPPAVSLPLDVGTATATVPPHLRRAVIARDRHCAAPGCRQRPSACHVHHIKPRSQGGATCLTNIVLLCPFHYLILIHRRGWTIKLNPDGTTTAASPDRTLTLHSHGPPEATAA